jgi:hypothetical protein
MKFIIHRLLVGIFVFCAIFANATTVRHEVSFKSKVEVNTSKATDGNTYSIVKLADCSLIMEEGAPQLPVKYINLIIPANEEAANVTYTLKGGTELKLDYPVLPAQKPIPTAIGFEGNKFVAPNKAIYMQDKPYPEKTARIIRTNYFRGNKIVVVEVSPVVYNPVKNQLTVYESVEVNLQLNPSKKVLETAPVRHKKQFDDGLRAMVANPEDVDQFSVIKEKEVKEIRGGEPSLKSAKTTQGISVYYDYVVVTSSSLASYFNDFIEWKNQKGVYTGLVTIEDIYQNYTGDQISGINDNAGKLRQFLSDAYDNGLEYALLGGDNTVLPIRYGWGSDGSTDPAYQIPTDLYFSGFSEDWEFDADGKYGEPGDIDNYGSDIYVGRLLCTNSTQIAAWTQKVLKYEQNPGNGSTSYLRNAFYTQADQMQDLGQATDIANRWGNVFTSTEIFEEEYNGVPNDYSPGSPQFPTGSDVINEMNSGYGFVSWFNHGAPDNIAVGTKLWNDCDDNNLKKKVTNTDSNPAYCGYVESGNGLDNLSNTNNPFILYTLSCETMPFDTWNNVAPTSNLGAIVTNQASKGGPAYLGNTRYGWGYESWYLERAFVANITGGEYHLGKAEAGSKGANGDHYVWLSHNLLGCPETEMWTDTPSDFTDAYAIYYNGDVIVYTGGITNCTICVKSSGGTTYWSAVDILATQHTFYSVPSPFTITISKHNYIPKIIQSSVAFTFTGPTVICSSAQYSVGNVPTGATIAWLQGANLTRVSAQGSNPCTFSANGSGAGWINAQIITSGNDTISLPTKTVWLGIPVINSILGDSTATVNVPEDYAVTYNLDCSPTGFWWGVNPNPLGLTINPQTGYYWTNITFPETGNYTITTQMQNTCGWSSYSYKNVAVSQNKSAEIQLNSPDLANGTGQPGMTISPNPTSGEATVTLTGVAPGSENSLVWDMEIYNEAQMLVLKKTGIKTQSAIINTQNMAEGVYIVRAIVGGGIVSAKLVVAR